MKNFRMFCVSIAAVLWVAGALCGLFIFRTSPFRVPLFLVLAGVTLIPTILGSRRYQIFGFVAFAGSIWVADLEHMTNLRHEASQQHAKVAGGTTQTLVQTNFQSSEIIKP